MQAKKTVPITFFEPDGKEHEVQAEVGKNLLDIAQDNNIELEGKEPLLLFVRSIIIFVPDLHLT
jgi:hypothetical protein